MSQTTTPEGFEPVTERPQGALVVIRGGNRIADGEKNPLAKGTVAIGRYEGSTPNKFDAAKLDYKLRSEGSADMADGTLVIFAETAALKRDFAQVAEGELIAVEYNGKREMTGKNKGKTVQDFRVLRSTNEA